LHLALVWRREGDEKAGQEGEEQRQARRASVCYSLPLAAGLVGIGLGIGRLGRIAERVMPVARIGGGAMMLVVGFYLLGGA